MIAYDEYHISQLPALELLQKMGYTYLPPEAYELFVKEVSAAKGWDITRVKTVYDLISCALSVLLSFLFFGFGHFEGIKAGTFLCALLNGWTIGRFGILLERVFSFEDRFAFREYFQS